MRLFIRHTTIIISIFIGLIGLIEISTSVIVKKYSDFTLPDNTRYIIVGHSHPECAFNDALIPGLKNVSQSGESYFYNYFKIKQIIKQNPSIDVVFIEYTNNQIPEYMNKRIWGNIYMSNRYPKYSSFMSVSDKFLLFRNNPSDYINALSLSVNEKIDMILEDDFSYSNKVGGYLYLVRDKTDSIINNMASLKSKTSTVKKSISEANLSYLDALIEFCKENGKEVTLIRTPQHEKYSAYDNEQTYKEILKTRYANIEYMDFSNYPLSNSEFGDLEHLNYKGAKVFSEWFTSLLNDGLLNREDKQAYIDERIKARMHSNVYKNSGLSVKSK